MNNSETQGDGILREFSAELTGLHGVVLAAHGHRCLTFLAHFGWDWENSEILVGRNSW